MKNKLALFLVALMVLSNLCSCSDSPVISDSIAEAVKGSTYKGESIEITADYRYIADMELYGDTLYMLTYSYNSDEDAMPTYHIFAYDTVNNTFNDTPYPQINNAYEFAISDSGILVQGTSENGDESGHRATAWCIEGDKIAWEISLEDNITFDSIGNNTLVGSLGDKWVICEAYMLLLFNSDGTFIKKEVLPANAVKMFASNGTLQICGYDTRQNYKYCCTVAEDGTVTESAKWLDALEDIPYSRIIHGTDSGIYYMTDSALAEYSIVDDTHTSIMDLVSSGIYGVTVSELAVHPSGEVYVCGGTADGSAKAVRRFSPIPEDELSGKQTVRVAYIEDGRNTVSLAAIKFNQSQADYEVVCVEYGSAAFEADYETVLKQLDLDIASGNAGDVIILDSHDEVKKYSDKGLFAIFTHSV